MLVYDLNRTPMLELKHILANELLRTIPVQRGEWQAVQANSPVLMTYELPNVVISYKPTMDAIKEAEALDADLPWAEAHFQERVSGRPLNPPPSAQYWPYHQGHEDAHKKQGIFSHTYPERYWPKRAPLNSIGKMRGIRYEYGDLADVILMLRDRPYTRQAYLPVFFPEDTGATEDQRIPCSLGYHFIRNGGGLDCNYFLRSCDLTRHFKNDVYMTVRLMQWVTRNIRLTEDPTPRIGQLTLFISNLHLFNGDKWRYRDGQN